MNNRQIQAIQLLRLGDKARHIYEGASAGNTAIGSGDYFVTYSAGHGLKLTRSDVDDLIQRGLIAPAWPDRPDLHMYRLASREFPALPEEK